MVAGWPPSSRCGSMFALRKRGRIPEACSHSRNMLHIAYYLLYILYIIWRRADFLRNTKIQKIPKLQNTKFTTYELWNLYILQNKSLNIFENLKNLESSLALLDLNKSLF